MTTYLTGRLRQVPQSLAQSLHQRTGGHPLCMVHLVEYMAQHGLPEMPAECVAMVQDIPETLRQMIERRFTHNGPEEQCLLEVASVAGPTFTAARLAAALPATVEQIEIWCTNLARRGLWLRAEGAQPGPDGTLSERYSFIHPFDQEVLYARLTAARRQRLERQLHDGL